MLCRSLPLTMSLAAHLGATLILAISLFTALPARGQEACPPPPAAVVDITSNRFYSDKAFSIVDQAAWDRRMASIKPLEDYRREVTRYASRGLAGNKAWSQCAGRWIAHWAAGGALLGRMNETQAHYERRWALTAIAMAYLMVKADMEAADRAVIEPWLDRVGEAVTAEPTLRSRNPNNLTYWAGAALGAVATATGNVRHWTTARRIYREGLTHIEPDGSLPREVARGRMALHYHNFALRPLIILAELSERRGETGYAAEKGAIHRLAKLTFAGLGDPSRMARLAGTEQRALERNTLGWLAFYEGRFPGRLAGAGPVLKEKDIWDALTGGNMSLLARKWVP